MHNGLIRIALLIISLLTLPPLALADTGKELFAQHCAGCHTIGGGDSGGPDLKKAAARPADWLVRIIVEPDKLAADKDPDQLALVKQYGFEMPNLGISRDDAQAIIAYLKGKNRSAATGPAAEAPKPAQTVATPELVTLGKALFTGARPFAKGGAPCIACHGFRYPGVTGGALAVDLSDRFEGMGEQGLRGVLKSLTFPIMKNIYADRPLTDEEITAIVALASDAAARKAPPAPPVYPAAGIGLFVCFIIGLTLYKRRIR